jgi:hypothetical protein
MRTADLSTTLLERSAVLTFGQEEAGQMNESPYA